jgi:Transposase DDE domain
MFIKRNRSRQGGKTYRSVLLVEGVREPVIRPRGRPPKDAPAKTRVVHHTLANLSRLPGPLVALIEQFCRGKLPTGEAPRVQMGPCYGLLAGLHALAGEVGLIAALGSDRSAKLALFLIYARVARQGSRLGAVRWAEDHAVAEVLGLEKFDEDDLYAALGWLQIHQERIERALAPKLEPGAVFLYDVTSSYLEGQCNELGAYGYNRDGKRYKKQVVAGLLTAASGEPLSIQLYPGNTSDPKTFVPTVEKLRLRFGAKDIVLVGDRGMIKQLGKEALGAAGFRYVTALTDPQIRKLLGKKVLTPELFDEEPLAIEHEGRRLILRCNPATRDRERQRRLDQCRRIEQKLAAGNARLTEKPRTKVATLRKQAQGWLEHYRFAQWMQLQVTERVVALLKDPAVETQLALLDGCYVLETDLPAAVADARTVHARYMNLTDIERDFRTMKTGQLELRPIFVRIAEHTEGHALVTMLALKLVRELDRRVAPLGLTVTDALARLNGVRLIGLGEPTLALWRLPDSYVAAQQEILAVLPTLPAPKLSLKKPIKRRLTQPRRGRVSPLK